MYRCRRNKAEDLFLERADIPWSGRNATGNCLINTRSPEIKISVLYIHGGLQRRVLKYGAFEPWLFQSWCYLETSLPTESPGFVPGAGSWDNGTAIRDCYLLSCRDNGILANNIQDRESMWQKALIHQNCKLPGVRYIRYKIHRVIAESCWINRFLFRLQF